MRVAAAHACTTPMHMHTHAHRRHRSVLCGVVAAAVIPAATAAAAPPPPGAALPTNPPAVAAALTDTTASLGDAVDAWRADGAAAPAPNDLVLLALYQQ